jgi:hypothetical protein
VLAALAYRDEHHADGVEAIDPLVARHEIIGVAYAR